MIVFDLDDCLWSPEMYTLYNKPSKPISGNLNPEVSKEESDEVGTIGMQVPGGGPTVKLFDGARRALREIALDPKYKGVIVAAASSSEEPTYSHSCLEGIEVLPGLTMRDMFRYVIIGYKYNCIGIIGLLVCWVVFIVLIHS
jgi:magnesium-dependent phosphatase 1